MPPLKSGSASEQPAGPAATAGRGASMRGRRAPSDRSAGAPGGCGGPPPLRPAAPGGSPLRLRPPAGIQPPHDGQHLPERRVLLSRYGPRARHIERCIPYPYVLHTGASLRAGTRRRVNEKSLSSENPGFSLGAEREGFEPPAQLPVHRLSSAARSTTPASPPMSPGTENLPVWACKYRHIF